MKQTLLKALIFMIGFAFFQSFSFGQSTKTITVQFEKDKVIGTRKKSTYHKEFVIKVENINTTLHKVVIKFDDFYWFSESPEALKTILPNIGIPGNKTLRAYNPTDAAKINAIDTAINRIKIFKGRAQKLYDSIPRPTNYLAQIGSLADSIVVSKVIHLEDNMNYFLGFYESLIEVSKTTGDTQAAQYIGEMKILYDYLKSNCKSLISAANAIIATKKKMPEDFFYSKTHTFSKPVTTAKIYIINKFDLDDTLATYEEDIYKDGKCTMDFSTGVALNNLVKPQYYIGDNGSGKFIGNEQTRPLDFSVVALLHFNVRIFSWLSAGPATGISVSAFDANTGYLYGLSHSFGKQRSISVTIGGILGKTVALSKKVSSNGTEADLPLPADISSVPTYDKIGTGGFISFTYNLTRIRK